MNKILPIIIALFLFEGFCIYAGDLQDHLKWEVKSKDMLGEEYNEIMLPQAPVLGTQNKFQTIQYLALYQRNESGKSGVN